MGRSVRRRARLDRIRRREQYALGDAECASAYLYRSRDDAHCPLLRRVSGAAELASFTGRESERRESGDDGEHPGNAKPSTESPVVQQHEGFLSCTGPGVEG